MTAPFFSKLTRIDVKSNSITLDGALSKNGIAKYEIYKNGSKISEQVINDDSYGSESVSAAEWAVNNCIMPNGGIWDFYGLTRNGIPMEMVPYVNEISCLLFLDMGYLDVVKGYLEWHMDHTNWADYAGVNGTIYDYHYDKITHAESHASYYDSIDSYSALFFVVLEKYIKAGGDVGWLQSYSGPGGRTARQVIDGIASSIEAVWVLPQNLTKPWVSDQPMLTMDNVEVYFGCVGISYIYDKVFNDATKKTYWSDKANILQQSIETNLWNGTRYPTAYGFSFTNQLYPDWMACVFPTFWGLLAPDSSRSVQIWNDFKTLRPNWVTEGSPPDGYAIFPAVGAKLGEVNTVKQYIQRIRDTYPGGYGTKSTIHDGLYGPHRMTQIWFMVKELRMVSFADSASPTDKYSVIAHDTMGEIASLSFLGTGEIIPSNDFYTKGEAAAYGSVVYGEATLPIWEPYIIPTSKKKKKKFNYGFNLGFNEGVS